MHLCRDFLCTALRLLTPMKAQGLSTETKQMRIEWLWHFFLSLGKLGPFQALKNAPLHPISPILSSKKKEICFLFLFYRYSKNVYICDVELELHTLHKVVSVSSVICSLWRKEGCDSRVEQWYHMVWKMYEYVWRRKYRTFVGFQKIVAVKGFFYSHCPNKVLRAMKFFWRALYSSLEAILSVSQ